MSIAEEELQKHKKETEMQQKKDEQKANKAKEEQINQKEQKADAKQETVAKEENDKTKALADEYLNLARVIQADFDNYRKRSLAQIEKAKVDGIAEAVELLLPSLDAFKKAKENIKDENTLSGINMLEKAINLGLEKLGVEKIDAVGLPLDPNYHNVLAVSKNEQKEDGIILEEFQAGYKMKDRVIRCSQVLVNKL